MPYPRAMALSLFSGALYLLGFPPVSLPGAGFFCLIPLFWALGRTDGLGKRFSLGFLFGLVLSAGLGWWLFTAMTGEYEKPVFLAIPFLFAFVAVPYGLVYALFAAGFGRLRRPSPGFYLAAVPALWVLAEYLKELIPFLLPWGNLGQAALAWLPLAQFADVGGLYGLSLVLALVNAAGERGLSALLRGNGKPARRREGLLYAAVFLAVPALLAAYGLLAMNRKAEGPELSATLVQGNFSLRSRWSGMGFYPRVKTYLDLSGVRSVPGPHVIVWSETVLNSLPKVNDALFAELMRQVGPEGLLVTGGLRAAQNPDGVHNTVYFLSGDGTVTWYDKNLLLPYAETAPLGDILGDYYNAPSKFTPGGTPPCVRTIFGPAGAFVCFEILYPGYVRKASLGGAGFFVNLSNDAWFGDTPMPWVHLDAARLRAIENRRPLLRTSNSGISAVIGPDGKILARTGLFTRQAVTEKFSPGKGKTLFALLGDWPPFFSALVLVLYSLAPLRKRGQPVENQDGR